jgi:hypothetical protein
MDGASLELKLVGDIAGRFFVPRYQRGYRWGTQEVGRLLDDLWENKEKPYSLQPVVVKKRGADEWELIDGQQRLTTLYLLFLYMDRERLQNAPPAYDLAYETRADSAVYLRELDAARRNVNIDFFHLYAAYEHIGQWFERHGAKRQYVANKLYGFLFENVRVIWYEAPADLDSTTLFTRLNVGRIPLTDAELVKALLLARSRGGAGRSDRAHEIAAQWDAIERDLRHPDVWAFVSGADADECPTRITLLLDAVAGGPRVRRPRFHTFDVLRQRIEEDSPQAVWNRVIDLHATVLGWFENRDLYHKVGYLVANGNRFTDLVTLADGQTKRAFDKILDERIRDRLALSPSDVTGLRYDNELQKGKCYQLLHLMNVETVRRMKHSTERYNFRSHLAREWSLEHIHAQHAEGLTKADQWKVWLEEHRRALETLPTASPAARDALMQKITSAPDPIDRHTFRALSREIVDLFATDGSAQSVHSIANLALLSCGDNSAIGNSVFEVKRRMILGRDRNGEYIPMCTRHVFLKYYTGADAQQVHFWSAKDREAYLDAMIGPEGAVTPYLRKEESVP